MSDSSASGFGQFVPGFEFLQNLASQAAGGAGKSLPHMPSLGAWVAPTFNVEELDKRITELKAVHFWLDQNAKALSATIQALEVQKMTLSTLQSMNVSMGDVAEALKVNPFATAAAKTPFAGLEVPPRTYGGNPPEAPPEPESRQPRQAPASQAAKATAPAPGVVDPVQWWGALSQQFQQIAGQALKDVANPAALEATRQAVAGLTGQAEKAAVGMTKSAAPKARAPRPAPAVKAPAARKAPAKSRR